MKYLKLYESFSDKEILQTLKDISLDITDNGKYEVVVYTKKKINQFVLI